MGRRFISTSRDRRNLRSASTPLQSGITISFGLPIPSTELLFLVIVGIHVLFVLAAVVSGAVAMLTKKGTGCHANYGTIYA
jgi:hypothetical protein